jgi:haloalkane dehalogenase
MKRLKFTALLGVILVSAFALLASAQDGTAEPVIYEGLEFPELPYPSRWIEVNGSKMHYLEAGNPAGDPILFLHGQPTWSYIWIDIMPHLEDYGRLIAVDFIGFGRSDRPDLEYRYVDHAAYIDAFIEAMALENITFVVHDWGSSLGLDYAARHPDNVKAIAYMEAVIPPLAGIGMRLDEMPQVLQDFFVPLRTDGVGQAMLIEQNFFVEFALQAFTVAELTEDQLNAYRVAFPTPQDRLPVWRWPNEIPFGGEPADVQIVLEHYIAWMVETDTPMLHLYAEPGAINPTVSVAWSEENVQNITTVNIGSGLHYFQHDQPHAIGEAIAN